MTTAVDTSVLLDVLLNDPQHAPASLSALRRASTEGDLVLGECALAELVPVLTTAELPQFLADWKLNFAPSTQAAALLAGEMFRTYLSRGGKRGRIVPDFLIAAHAQSVAHRLLARDRGYYRDHFRQLTLWDPSVASQEPVS
jgi:predicted nucleic acid-binding protein